MAKLSQKGKQQNNRDLRKVFHGKNLLFYLYVEIISAGRGKVNAESVRFFTEIPCYLFRDGVK